MNEIRHLSGLLKVSSVLKTRSSEEAFLLDMILNCPKKGFYWNWWCHCLLCLLGHHLPQDRTADTGKLIFKKKVFISNDIQ